MKKVILTIFTIFLMLFCLMTISVSATRYTELPISLNHDHFGSSSIFTMTDFEIYIYPNETPKYTNTASIYIEGCFNQGTRMDLTFYCYNASGNHLKTINETMYSYDFEEYEDNRLWCNFNLEIPDVTASIEVCTTYPGSWSNSYYYCKYMNVYSDDGRALGIHDLLLPVYENCGWHGPVWMYSADGREIEVQYCNVSAYQSVGWYLWEDYYYNYSFLPYYNYCINNGNYSDAYDEIEWAIEELAGTYYESSLYSYKTKLMDAWRKKINAPLAYCYDYVDEEDRSIEIEFRNVSYETIKAFKVDFDCFDIFGNYLEDYTDYYYTTDAWLYPSESGCFTWEELPYGTDHIGNFRITQVVYSNGTSWYR